MSTRKITKRITKSKFFLIVLWQFVYCFLETQRMIRLNSGIFRIFKVSVQNLNLNSSDCRALKIITNDTKLEPISWELNLKNSCFFICVGVWVRGQDAANFWHIWKDAQKNFASFDTNVVLGGAGANMVLNEKPTKNWKLRGLKLRGLGQNQISTPHFIYENDHRNKINIFRDFENETPTHMSATHAISKIEQKSQNRIPRE